MAFSYTTKTGDGTTTSFTFAFEGQDEGYIREGDIVATVDGADAPFSLLSYNTLEFNDAPSNGSEIIIRRVMPKNVPYADFQRGNNFGQDVLNNSFLQLLYIVHELLDGWFPEDFTIREAVEFLENVKLRSGLEVDGGITATSSDPNDPDGVVTFSSGDSRYVNKSGDTMKGSLDFGGNPVYVRVPSQGNEPARKDQLDSERSSRQASDASIRDDYQEADANLQAQLSETLPLEASAFSPISWHDQVVENSVTIPENKNAWSFGPTMSISSGQSVTIGNGSFWTIANGEQQQ